MERATFDDLIARKLQREKDREAFREIHVPSMGKTLAFHRPADSETIGFLDVLDSSSNVSDVYEMYKEMIYKCCPLLHSDKVREAFEVTVPTDVVPKIMDPADVMQVGETLSKFLGLERIGEDVKN